MQHAPPGEGKAPPGQLPWVDSRPQDVKSRDSEHSCHQAALLEHLEPLACRPGRGGHGHLSDGLAEEEGPSVSTMDSTKSLGNSLWPGPQQPQRSDKVLGVALAGLGMGMA